MVYSVDLTVSYPKVDVGPRTYGLLWLDHCIGSPNLDAWMKANEGVLGGHLIGFLERIKAEVSSTKMLEDEDDDIGPRQVDLIITENPSGYDGKRAVVQLREEDMTDAETLWSFVREFLHDTFKLVFKVGSKERKA